MVLCRRSCMAVVFSDNAIRAIRGTAAGAPEWTPPASESLWMRGGQAQQYRATPALRTVVDLLARNTAQLGLHLYRRADDDSRTRDRTSNVARLLKRPNSLYSPFDLILRTVMALGIYGEAYWWKEGPHGARSAYWYVSPRELTPIRRGWSAGMYRWNLDPQSRPLDAENFARIWWPDPEDDWLACPLLETLRSLLAEDAIASRHRMNLWRTGARWQGVIERPKDAGRWDDQARARFREQLSTRFGGPAGAGGIPVLEDGMTFKETSWSPVETESNAVRQTNTEEITRSYQVPLPMAGILEHGTSYASVREMHKQLYQDTLGPLNAQIEGALNLQLLPEEDLFETHYLEFNVNDKMQGSFEEQSAAMSRAVGRPWLTVNEVRAMQNRPGIPGGDELAPQPGSGTPSPPRPLDADEAAALDAVH
jgi:HK97 family phage portal protein